MDRKHNTHSHLQALEQTCDPGHRVGLYCKKERLCVIINPSPQGSSDRSQLFFSAAAIKSKGYQGIKKKDQTNRPQQGSDPTGPAVSSSLPATAPCPLPRETIKISEPAFQTSKQKPLFSFPLLVRLCSACMHEVGKGKCRVWGIMATGALSLRHSWGL